MILVFAGAGASYSVDPEQYPTTVEFFERLPSEVTKNQFFQETHRYLKSLSSGRLQIDIEHVLDALDDFRSFCKKSRDVSTLPGWMIVEGTRELAEVNPFNVHIRDKNDFSLRMKATTDRLTDLEDLILNCIYDFYAPPPLISSLANWMSLLKSLSNPYRGLEIFTTNYDRVLEEVVLVSENLVNEDPNSKDVAMGRKYDGRDLFLDIDSWNPERELPEGRRVRLTKLHGSVDWKWENPRARRESSNMGTEEAILEEDWNSRSAGRRVMIGDTGFAGNHEKHIILYPGKKLEYRKDPFDTFYDHLIRVVAQSEAAIFVGYAFRDQDINDVLSALPANIPMYVFNVDNTPPKQAFLQDPIHFGDGFTHESIKTCVESLKEHNLIASDAI